MRTRLDEVDSAAKQEKKNFKINSSSKVQPKITKPVTEAQNRSLSTTIDIEISDKQPVLMDQQADIDLSNLDLQSWNKMFESLELSMFIKQVFSEFEFKHYVDQVVTLKKSDDLISPTENLKVDTYNLFVRGKVVDKEGVMNLVVKGNKTSLKSDGMFVTKVKLGYGINEIKIQAEDVNGNVQEKVFKQYNPTASESIFYTKLFGTLISFIVTLLKTSCRLIIHTSPFVINLE